MTESINRSECTDDEPENIVIRANRVAAIIAAANRLAGIGDGYVRIEAGRKMRTSIVCDASDAGAIGSAISAALKERFDRGSDRTSIVDAAKVYADRECTQLAKTAVLSVQIMLPTITVGEPPPTYNKEDEEVESDTVGKDEGAVLLEKAGARANELSEHLERIGFIARVIGSFEERDEQTFHYLSISAFALLSEPDTTNDEHQPAPSAMAAQRLLEGLLGVQDVSVDLGSVDCLDLTAIDLDNKDADAFVKQVATTASQLERLASIWENCGRNIGVFSRMVPPRGDPPRVEFLVPGLIPAGMLTVVVGAHEVGKSTLMHELAVAIAATAAGFDGWSWLGRPISKSRARGAVAFLCGEDTEGSIYERAKAIDPESNSFGRLASWPLDPRRLPEILEEVRTIPELALLVVDPMRKYLEGSEDDSTNVNRFFNELDKLTLDKKCAIVVSHHLSKNANPVNVSGPGGVISCVRGSTVIIDRPRVVIGLLRQRDKTIFKIGKTNLTHISGVFRDPITLTRNPTTLRHLPVDVTKIDAQPQNKSQADHSAEDSVLSALNRLHESGIRVTRTGDTGLYEQKAPELMGMSRAKVRATVGALLDAGRISMEAGRIAVAESATQDTAATPVSV